MSLRMKLNSIEKNMNLHYKKLKKLRFNLKNYIQLKMLFMINSHKINSNWMKY